MILKTIKLFNLIICLLLIHEVGAQEQKVIRGIVRNHETSETLEFAHIYIKGSTIGTYANAEGEFIFNFPDSLATDTLIVSRVGYETFELNISKIDPSVELQVSLKESDDYLDEVIVYSSPDTLRTLIKKVFKNFRKNYPTKLHYLEGFYRELSLKGDEYTRLIEASIGVTENSYRKAQTKTKIKVRQVRKSEDYREYNLKMQLYGVVFKKLTELAWGKSWLHYNNISKLLKLNVAKVDRRKISFWVGQEYDFVDAYDFELAKVSEKNGSKFYHITFERPHSVSGIISHYGGEIIINRDDYAIVEYTSGLIPHPHKPYPNIDHYFSKKGFHNQSHIIYSKFEGKYYPTFFESYEPILDGERHVNPDGKEEYQYSRITFMVNQVVTHRKDFDRIKRREAIEDDLNLYDMEHSYDSVFWANYNIMLLDPILKPIIEDLEKEKSLEAQFKDHGVDD